LSSFLPSVWKNQTQQPKWHASHRFRCGQGLNLCTYNLVRGLTHDLSEFSTWIWHCMLI
jgi:hypothetical protein